MSGVLTIRGREKIIHEGHMFCFDKTSKDGSINFWRCDKRSFFPCKARLHTTRNGAPIKLLNEHTHGGSASAIEVAKIVTDVKKRAETTQEPPAAIINEAIEKTSLAVKGELPKKGALKKQIIRKRNAVLAAPAVPADLASIVIPEDYALYEFELGKKEQFLLYDSGEGDMQRVLIFGRRSHVDWSQDMKKLYVDGTFRIAPALFSQVYVIMAERRGFVFPVVYCLLPNKQEATYDKMWQGIKSFWPLLSPDSISTDFEQAALNSMKRTFPNATLFGCLFHLVRNMKKKLSEEGLMRNYNQDAEFALSARKIIALAFVPPEEIEEAFEELQDNTPNCFQPILNWFEDNYMGRPYRRGRRAALFPIEIWSVYQRSLDGDQRTNNYVEACHRTIQIEMQMDHPTLWKFINAIHKIQAGRDQAFEEYVRGDDPIAKRRKYKQADERILTILHDRPNRSVDEFLRGIAHNFEM